MSNQNQTSRIAEVEVGTPPSGFQRWETARVYFHGFEELDTRRGKEVESPKFTLLGQPWSLSIYPGGSEINLGLVSIYVNSFCTEAMEVDCVVTVRDAADKEVCEWAGTYCFSPDDDDNGWGFPDCATHSKLLGALTEGTLVVEVRMNHHGQLVAPFIPANPLTESILDIFLDEESADIVFIVTEETSIDDTTQVVSAERPPKKMKTIERGQPKMMKPGRRQLATKAARKSASPMPRKFHAHSFVLQRSGSLLAELCKPGSDAGSTRQGGRSIPTISITDASPLVFEHFLFYLYGGDLSEKTVIRGEAEGLIDLANKYGLVHLKLEAEAIYVRSIELGIDNVLDNLLYADAMHLALLKEAVMDYILENRDEVMDNVSFEDVPGSVVKDLLAAVNRGEKKSNAGAGGRNYNSMRVGTLRKMLDDEGLDVDGSRETMIARLRLKDGDKSDGSDE